MKLATIAVPGGARIAVIDRDRAHIIEELAHLDMAAVAGRWPEFQASVATALRGEGLPLAGLRLLPPVTRPGKIMAIGLNYADHIRESSLPWPEYQTWFAKHLSSLNGPYDPIEVPKASDALDFEAELVVVIGKGGRHIPADRASEHVFGYCVGNDVSVRDWQLATSQWVTGKSFDTHAPIGPWITTVDEIGDPHRLGIRCEVNGEVRQESNTRELVFNIWDQIAHVSQAMTLMPGDLIFTGTPGGIGFAEKPPRKLVAGDVVKVEIEALGYIENICRDEI